MQLNTLTNQTIALAGIAQAAALAQQLAVTGSAEQQALQASVGSILKVNTDAVIDVFDGLIGLKLGITELAAQLADTRVANPERARYAAQLVFLEKKLSKEPSLLKAISAGIEKAQFQSEHFGLLHENVLASLGDIYHTTISTLQPRIMINGDEAYLGRPDIVNKIRSVLLAGIRSTLLWRQCGGSRWRFLFYRKKYQAELQRLLAELNAA
ncbi:MAG: high frequency lysogenization protein HflD [Methylococcaceae bacterium]|nr:high frequency lysogenization protein HflD [Methylococcaceae bacterium]